MIRQNFLIYTQFRNFKLKKIITGKLSEYIKRGACLYANFNQINRKWERDERAVCIIWRIKNKTFNLSIIVKGNLDESINMLT